MVQLVYYFVILELGSLSGSTRVVDFNLARPLPTAQGSIVYIYLNGLISS